MHVSCLEWRHFLWKLCLPLTTQHHKNNLKTTTSVMVETGKKLSIILALTHRGQQICKWTTFGLCSNLCPDHVSLFLASAWANHLLTLISCSDFAVWDNNPYLHFGIVRSIQFLQSALASQMKGHLEVKSVLLPLLLTCLKGKPQPDKTPLNKHHPVLERQQSPIQLQKPPTSTNFANWTNYWDPNSTFCC